MAADYTWVSNRIELPEEKRPMIDWDAKVRQFKATADELELWAGKSEGHIRLVLGRTADEIRQLIREVEFELHVPEDIHATAPLELPSQWSTEGPTGEWSETTPDDAPAEEVNSE